MCTSAAVWCRGIKKNTVRKGMQNENENWKYKIKRWKKNVKRQFFKNFDRQYWKKKKKNQLSENQLTL